MVDAKAVRRKLSKQLKIDLEPHEKIHLRKEPVISHAELTELDMKTMMEDMGDPQEPCKVEIRQLGEFLARISLRGGYSIPLKVEILKR